MNAFGQKSLSSGKSSFIPESGYNWAKVVVFGRKLLYSGKSGCIRAN